jgi:ABC-2 type transport system permease protein
VVAFLNLAVVNLLLATFTSRFVFPLLSLEGQQLWLLGLLPVRRTTVLAVKFLFALVITGVASTLVMGLAVYGLGLPRDWAWLHIVTCAGVCLGLSGLSIGLGARFPVLAQRNPARIASGLGGTLNLIVSMVFVCLQLAGVAGLTLSEITPTGNLPNTLSAGGVLIAGCLLGTSVATALVSLLVGARHFERLES